MYSLIKEMIYKNSSNNIPVNLIIDIGSKNLKFFVYQTAKEKVKVEYYYQVEHGINFSFLNPNFCRDII